MRINGTNRVRRIALYLSGRRWLVNWVLKDNVVIECGAAAGGAPNRRCLSDNLAGARLFMCV